MKCLKRLFCTRRKKHLSGVYILQLEKGKFYVGQSDDIDRRIWVHTNHNGSAWTKKYNVVERLPLLTSYQPYFWELVETLEMMKEHGIDNVRGSMFASPFELKPFEKILAAQLYCELHDLCRKCGGKGHFINQCDGKMSSWVSQFGGSLDISDINKRKCNNCNCSIDELPRNFRYCRPCFKKINNY